MQYWKMQLHPSGDTGRAALHAHECLAAGYVGLDFHFDNDEGDLRETTRDDLKDQSRKPYYDFCDKMQIHDLILIVCHHYPIALCRVESNYAYVTDQRFIGQWFKHFREVEVLAYYRDYILDPSKWTLIRTPNAISPVLKVDSDAFQLMKDWYDFLVEKELLNPCEYEHE